jgi:hypothetical protein
MEESADYSALIACIDMLQKQREQALKDLTQLRQHQKADASDSIVETNEKLFVTRQKIQPLPRIDWNMYEKLVANYKTSTQTSTSQPEKKRKRLFDLDLSSEESNEEEEEEIDENYDSIHPDLQNTAEYNELQRLLQIKRQKST